MSIDDIERRVLDHSVRADTAQVLATLALVREVRRLAQAVEDLDLPSAECLAEHGELLRSVIADVGGQLADGI